MINRIDGMERELGHRRRRRDKCKWNLAIAALVILVGLEFLASVLNVNINTDTLRSKFYDYPPSLTPTTALSAQQPNVLESSIHDEALDSVATAAAAVEAIDDVSDSGVGSEAMQATEPQEVQPSISDNDKDGDGDDELCLHISSSLDIASWPDVIYHKDREDEPSNHFDGSFVTSVEEDDSQARATIHEFNKIRPSVLTPPLLKAGFQPGRIYPIRRFADRIRRLTESMNADNNAEEQQPPLRILVFGSSFTIGSNCGESTMQDADDCAWPLRLKRRFDDIFSPYINDEATRTSLVQWTMYQENAQGSVNVAQKIPSIVDEFINENTSPDVILLDNTIIDLGMNKPWFEASVRAFIEHFPGTVIVSIVDGIPQFGDNPENWDISNMYTWLYDVQKHYGLTVVDMGKMTLLQRHDTTGTYIERSVIDEAKRVYREHPARGNDYDENSTIINLLWPQSSFMLSGNGSALPDQDTSARDVYWLEFIPWTRKTKHANYPSNHPPWVTHQYVADTIMHGLLNLARIGLECGGNDDDDDNHDEVLESSVLETSVATMEELDAAFICETPVTRIDAKSPAYVDHVIANLISTDNNTIIPSDIDDTVAVSCGDWKWITDDRQRSGWQSDEYGSIIRFRLKVSNEKLPTISITYMRSHATFGNPKVTFHPVTRKDLKENPSPPPVFGCNDIDRFLPDENGAVAFPSVELDGSLPQFTLWYTAVFPPEPDWSDLNSRSSHELLRDTVLNRMQKSMEDSDTVDDDDIVEFVDLYVVNTHTRGTRVKIQIVSSC